MRGKFRWTWMSAGMIGIVAALVAAAPASADPAVTGQWGALQQYPVVPVSMGVMPDGKIVAWDQANKPPNFGSIPNNGPAMILDPATGAITRTNNIAPRTTFCSLIASLPDGRLAIIGGGSDNGSGAIADVQLYDPDSKTFSTLGQMKATRWYPGGTLDRDGNPIVAGGTSKGIERFDQLTGGSTLLDSTIFPSNWYPDLIRRADGSFVIEDVGDNASAGPGRFLLSGTTLTSMSDRTLLQTRRRGIRTMVGPYKMFYNSGGTSTASLMIDASGPTPTYTAMASSRYPHMTGEAVTLPTGDVLAIGGNSSGDDTKGTPVFTPELYSVANNSWTSMADSERRRTYHSVAALLPDGRVWSAGSSFDEVQEPNGAFFSPPYLFRKDGSGQLATRPTATDAPSSVAAGQSFSVATNNPSNIASAAFIRLAATTHQVNAGQAYVPLSVSPGSGRVAMTAPSVDQAPPGYYMLFLIDNQGVPSIAPVIRFDKTAGATPQPRVTQSSQFDQASQAWNAFDGDATQTGSGKYGRTLAEDNPWWQVDLGQSKDLSTVTVRPRTDCCSNASRDLWLFASDSPFESTTISGLRTQAGVKAVHLTSSDGGTVVAPVNRTARYLRVQSANANTSLGLAEVEPATNKAPTVSVTAPSSGATFTAPATYSISASAADTDGQIQKVEFFRGSASVGTDTSAPYSVSDTGVSAGTYSLTAVATDDNGATTTSTPVSITVSNPVSTGPVAAYAFDEGSGPSAADKSGNGLTGTVSGASWSTSGHSGKALSFDGNDDFVNVADNAKLDMTSAFTLEGWVKPRSFSGWKMLMLKEAPPNTLSYGLYGSAPGAARPSAWTQGGSVSTSTALQLNAWSHVATTYSGGTMRLYINGSLAGTETGVPAPVPSSGAFRIGGNSIWTEETFDGLIDDVRVYDRALSGAEIATDRDTPVAPAPPPSGPTPVLDLTFDDGAGSVATDSSGLGHNGTLSATGASWTPSGYRGGAISLNGSGSVAVADHADLDLTSAMTLEAWVRTTSSKSWQTVMMKEAPPGSQSYTLDATAGGGRNANAWVGDGGVVDEAQVPLNTWTHLAFTLSGGVGRLYRNGVLVSQSSGMGSAIPSNGTLRIGNDTIWQDEGFIGQLDDLRVYNTALSASEIAAQVPGTVPGTRKAPSNPLCLKKHRGQRRVKPGKCR